MADEQPAPVPWYKELIAIRQTLIIVLTPILLLPLPIATWRSSVSVWILFCITAIWTRGTGTCIICEKHVAGDESRCFSAIAACRSCQTTLSLFRLTFDPSRKTASAWLKERVAGKRLVTWKGIPILKLQKSCGQSLWWWDPQNEC